MTFHSVRPLWLRSVIDSYNFRDCVWRPCCFFRGMMNTLYRARCYNLALFLAEIMWQCAMVQWKFGRTIRVALFQQPHDGRCLHYIWYRFTTQCAYFQADKIVRSLYCVVFRYATRLKACRDKKRFLLAKNPKLKKVKQTSYLNRRKLYGSL